MGANIIDQYEAINAADARGASQGGVGAQLEMSTSVPTTTTTVSGLTGMTAITFPAGLGDDPHQPFFMTFVPKKITSAVGGTMGDLSFQSVSVTKNNIAQVALPIPTGINAAYAQSWDQTDVSAAQGAIMQTGAFKSIAGSVRNMAEENKTTTIGDAYRTLSAHVPMNKEDFMEGMDAAKASFTGGMGAISNIISKIPSIGISGNTVAGATLGVAGKILGPAMSTAAGFASFNQMMAHYNGPAFRNFSFTFTLRPLDPKDQTNIVKIVDFFKIASAPSQISNGLYRMYEIPYIFKIGFYSRKGELQDVNKIAHCACTSVAVSYGGDRFQTFSGTDSPVETNLVLSFKEIELITRDEMEIGY